MRSCACVTARAALLFLFLSAPFSTSAGTDLERLQTQMRTLRNEQVGDLEQPDPGLLKKYEHALIELEKQFTREGSLDGLIAVKAEKQRLHSARKVSRQDVVDQPEALKRLQEIFLAEQDKSLLRRCRTLEDLADKYEAALEQLQVKLTQDGAYSEAIKVKSERERIQQDPLLVTARRRIRAAELTAEKEASPSQNAPIDRRDAGGGIVLKLDDATTSGGAHLHHDTGIYLSSWRNGYAEWPLGHVAPGTYEVLVKYSAPFVTTLLVEAMKSSPRLKSGFRKGDRRPPPPSFGNSIGTGRPEDDGFRSTSRDGTGLRYEAPRSEQPATVNLGTVQLTPLDRLRFTSTYHELQLHGIRLVKK